MPQFLHYNNIVVVDGLQFSQLVLQNACLEIKLKVTLVPKA